MAYLHKKFKKLARSEDVATVATSSRVATTTTSSSSSRVATTTASSRSGQAEEIRWDQMIGFDTVTLCTRLPAAHEPAAEVLKHSVGSMVAAPVPSPEPSRNICPHCGLVCHKPSVLEKHMR